MSTKLGTLTLDLVARIGSFTQGMRNASASAEREMGRAGNSVNTVDGLLKKLAATAGAVFSVGQIVNYADSYTGMVNKLKLVTTNQGELSQAMTDTHKIAQDTASEWSGVLDVYTKFQGLSKRLGIDQAEVARITETVTKTVSMSGQSAAASEAALLQFGQALNTGLLRGAELTSVMSQAPALAKALAEGMGVAVGDLKKMGEEGQITSEKMRDALLKMSSSVDAEYAKTATTVAASFNYMKNEAVKFIGEFDGATGASAAFVSGMKTLSENMGAITTTMGVGAAFMAGTYIPTMLAMIKTGYVKTAQLVEQTAIQYSAIQAERASAASSLAQAQAQMVNTQSTLAALAAEKALEVQRLAAQINAAGRMASTTRMAQLRQIEVQVTAELVAAETALANARARSAAAGAASVGVGGRLLGILGGPVGMGVTLAAVAASYLLMKGDAEKATTSIEYQGQKLDDLVVKYRELNTLQRDNETNALADQLDDLSLKFKVAASDLSSFISALPASDEKIAFFEKLTREFQNGRISSGAYYESVKNANFLSDKQLEKVRGLIAGHSESKQALDGAKKAQEALSLSTGKTTGEIKNQAVGVAQLSEELKKLLSTNAESAYKSKYLNEVVKRNVDPKLGEMLYEARKAEGLLGTGKALSEETRKSVLDRWNAEKGLNKTLEDRTKAEEKSKKLIEAQGGAMKVNALVAANAVKANYVALESAKNLPKGLLSAVNMTESPNSNYAKSGAGAQGAFQFMPRTASAYKVDVNSVESSAKGASEYLNKLLKMFEGNLENALRAYNWGEGNMQNYLKYGSGMKKVDGKLQKGYFPDRPMPKETRDYSGKVLGYMGGASGVSFSENYSYSDYIKEQEQFAIEREKQAKEQAQKQKEIQLGAAAKTVRIRTDLADKLKEIEGSGFDAAETARLKAEYTTRAENEIKIAESAHADKLAEYSAYVKTEEQLINESYDRRQRDLKLDLELTHDEYTQASLNIETMRKREIEAIQRDQALELLEVKRDWMNREQYAEEYYALVRAEILATANYSPEKKNASIKQANSQQGVDQAQQREGIWADYTDRFAPEQLPYDQDAALLKAARDEMLITEEEYQKQRLAMQMTYGSQYGADFAGMMMGLVDSSSSAYAVLGAVQKGAALFSTAMNSYTAISAAWASAPFPYNLPAVGMATMETGLLQAAVSAMSPVGMAHDGIDNIPKEGTWLLDKGERVVDSRTNGDLKQYLANRQSDGPKVTINNNASVDVSARQNSDGTLTIDVVERFIADSLSQPNSKIRKSLNRNTTATARR